MAAHSASIKGASKVMVVDSHPDRPSLLKNWVPFLLTFERFRCGTGTELPKAGADKGCECVGYQCCDKHGTEHSNITMNELVQAVKATGSIGVVEFCSRRS
jgi:threonine dehydrogenase-like Zn-dependent dehydrogenase